MFVIDESSYRIDKTSFPTAEEAEQRAGEAARILNRAINVYELLEGELHFAFRVLPCGDVETEQPTVDPDTGDQIVQEYPVLGDITAELDLITEELEAKGATELAARLDRVVHKLTAEKTAPGIRKLVASLRGRVEAGWSYAVEPLFLSLVSPTNKPFNIDTIADITNVWLDVKGDDGSGSAAPTVTSKQTSGIVTRIEEQQGMRSEAVVTLSIPKGYGKQYTAAIQKKLGRDWKVEKLSKPRKPKPQKAGKAKRRKKVGLGF